MLPSQYKWKTRSQGTKNQIIEQILINRAVTEEEQIQRLLHPDTAQLYDPYLLNDMASAVERIIWTKVTKEAIVIYGDYDVDGVTSTSVLYMFLKEQGYKVSYYIPNRQTEGYGLNQKAIKQINEYARLIITVDTGIAACEEVAYANEIGLDVIITDHHECQEVLPKAYCIINPKKPGNTYPFESLAGVGVAFKLIHALALREDAVSNIWKYLDLVALGTVADVVPLIDENRVITHLGFKQMAHTMHSGLRVLLDWVQGKENKINSNMIGYQLGPRINAAGRLSDAKLGVELLTTEDKEKAKKITKDLDDENRKRQEMEAHILEEAIRYIEQNIDVKNEKMIVVIGEGWHHGLLGIVASRIMGKYYRPTIVLTLEHGVYSGSARSIEGFNIFEALSTHRERLIKFGGHEMAAGLSLLESEIQDFTKAINKYTKEFLAEELLTPTLDIDIEIEPKDLSLKLCEEIERLEPFGAGNPSPTFALRGELQYAQTMGQDNKHLKLSIQKGHYVFQAVGFFKGYLADYLTEGEEVVIAGEIVKNEWNGRTTLQVRIKDIQSPTEKIIESKYYLSLYSYLKEPPIISRSKIKLEKIAIKPRNIRVYTEKGLKEIYSSYKNTEKPITNYNKICYNEWYGLKEIPQIFVNSDVLYEEHECINYEWDFKSTDNYTCINQSISHHIAQIPKMVPSYMDCKVIYKFLKNTNKDHIYLHKAVTLLQTCNMTEYKLLQALDVFEELGLIEYRLVDDQLEYKFQQSSKNNLKQSKRYMHLQKFKECICN